jgi:sec-independent protein translocase protein TatB
MLDVGFSEILLTSAIALIVLGPERLPKVARQVGNWMGRARAMARQLSEQLEREVNAEELLKLQNKPVSESPKAGIVPVPIAPSPGIAPPTISPPAVAPTTGVLNPAGIASPPTDETGPAVGTAPVDAHTAPAAPPASTPDPVYGLAASATTAAAMHAVDKKAAQ